ncbi:hypothetical protein OIA45_49075 (plasmid) [Streptomyces chartreusis]|uniref:hypothetical protein n=1 Tax=Streptomyces chartreusis TaxID=1969 RepID=UPI0037DD3316|nr:hypothetical protein OIA45_49075 [Streptomyces chartreusis]
MRNASAAIVGQTPAHLVPRQNPNGDFAATYLNTPAGRYNGRLTIDQIGNLTEGRLSAMVTGTFVLISGTIESVRLFGDDLVNDWNYPRATVRLSSGTGADVVVDVSTAHYGRIWGYLVMGRRFGLAGHVRRPQPDAPIVVDFVRLLMTRTDVLTAEAYAEQRQAVTL